MFVELKQLLAVRSLTITVAMLSNDQMRVNVVPNSSPDDKKANEKIGYSHKEVAPIPEEAINALTTPVSITGTFEEIDANLPTILSKYVESHAQLQELLFWKSLVSGVGGLTCCHPASQALVPLATDSFHL